MGGGFSGGGSGGCGITGSCPGAVGPTKCFLRDNKLFVIGVWRQGRGAPKSFLGMFAGKQIIDH